MCSLTACGHALAALHPGCLGPAYLDAFTLDTCATQGLVWASPGSWPDVDEETMPEPLVSIAPLANDTLCVGPMLGQTPKPGLPRDAGRDWRTVAHDHGWSHATSPVKWLRTLREPTGGACSCRTRRMLCCGSRTQQREGCSRSLSQGLQEAGLCGVCCRGSGRALSPGWPPASL